MLQKGGKVSKAQDGPVRYANMASIADTGPDFAPDRLSVWPVEGELCLDATYHWRTGFEPAEAQRQRLENANLAASVKQEPGDHWTLRLGLSPTAPSGRRSKHS